MSTLPKSYLTPEQYLEIERKAEFKSEYYQGEMFAMSGARFAHIQIVANAMRELGQQLRGRPCQPLSNDMRVRVTATGLYTYPDVVVVCGEPRFLDDTFDTLLNPTVIIEVLSESTEAYDRGQKFEQYRSLESLAEYMMISSQRVSVERYTRQPDGSWNFTAKASPEDSLDLKSVGCHLLLADLYEKIDFSPPEPATV
ncbi:MAG: Uma2 family endonuclease [Bryobacteraceae bacterium]